MTLDATTVCSESVQDDRVIPPDVSFACVVLGQHNKQQNEPSVNNRRRIPSRFPAVRTDHGQLGRSGKGGGIFFVFLKNTPPGAKSKYPGGSFFFPSTNDPPGVKTKNRCLQAEKVVGGG